MPRGLEILLAINVKAFDLIKDEGLCKSLDVGLNGLGGGFCLAAAVSQKPFTDKGIANRGSGNGVTDVIRKEHHQFSQQQGIGDSSLTLLFFLLQNAAQRDGGIHAVQRSGYFVCFLSHISQHRHAAEVGIVFLYDAISQDNAAMLIKNVDRPNKLRAGYGMGRSAGSVIPLYNTGK